MHFICWWKALKHKLVQFSLKQFSSLGKSLTDHVDAWLNIFVFQLPMQTLWLHYLCLVQPRLKYKLSALLCNSWLQGCNLQRTCTSLSYLPFKFCSTLVTELTKIKTKKCLLQSWRSRKSPCDGKKMHVASTNLTLDCASLIRSGVARNETFRKELKLVYAQTCTAETASSPGQGLCLPWLWRQTKAVSSW